MTPVEWTATYGLAWLATACYFDASRLELLAPAGEREPLAARRWAAGATLAFAHVAASLHFAHRWSFEHAAASIAARTAATLGSPDPSAFDGRIGLAMNLLFVAAWAIDAATRVLAPRVWAARPLWLAWAVRGYLAFIVFNATVAFGSLPMKFVSLSAIAGLVVAWRIGARRRASRASASAD